ncbi:MAG: hypothetical protein WA159_12815 [Variovorax sp.]
MTDDSAPAPDAGRRPTHPLLAKRHQSTRVDYSGLLGSCQRSLNARGDTSNAEMLRQLQGHIKELGTRWYAGDTAAVDEIPQLYCVENDAREALSSSTQASGSSQRAREMADEVHAELDATDDAWTQEDIERVQGTLLPRVYDCLNLLAIALPAAQPTGSAAPSNPAVPPGFALIPKRMTLAMHQVLNGDEWDWADLLEAAEVITEDEHRSILRYDSLALIEKFEEMASTRYPADGALPALSMSYAPYADVEFRDDSGKLLGVVCAGSHQAGMVSALRSAAGTTDELDRSQEQAPR